MSGGETRSLKTDLRHRSESVESDIDAVQDGGTTCGISGP